MSKIINIQITIDTDGVKKAYPKPSQNSGSPTGIGHQYGFMVATGTTVNSGQGTGDLSINALVGDNVRTFGVSGSNNFEDAVLIYNMPRYSGTQVLGPQSNQEFTKSTVVPGSTSEPLPPRIINETFWFLEADVVAAGTENYKVQFGLWTRSEQTGQPVLFGYYQWDPQIKVVG